MEGYLILVEGIEYQVVVIIRVVSLLHLLLLNGGDGRGDCISDGGIARGNGRELGSTLRNELDGKRSGGKD
jgi:hypothetical protein